MNGHPAVEALVSVSVGLHQGVQPEVGQEDVLVLGDAGQVEDETMDPGPVGGVGGEDGL